MKTILNDIPNREALLSEAGALKIGFPGLAPGAIMALESIVNKKMKVLEFGSGGSTIFWAKNCKNVKSFETDSHWFIKVKERVSQFRNVEIILGNQKQILKRLEKEPDNHYDIVLVDSYPKHTERIILANTAVPKVKTGGWLIIDNYLKFGMENFSYPKSEIYTFDEIEYSGRGTRVCKKI